MQDDLIPGSPNTLSLAFAEGLYADYLKDPSLVSEAWQEYFSGLAPDADLAQPDRRLDDPRRADR